jgi:hypothetical protein
VDAIQCGFMNGIHAFNLKTCWEPAPWWVTTGHQGREDGHLPNSSIQHHSDRDVEVAEGFGHFLTEDDMRED